MNSEPDAGVKELPNGGFDFAATAEPDPKRLFARLSMRLLVRAPGKPPIMASGSDGIEGA